MCGHIMEKTLVDFPHVGGHCLRIICVSVCVIERLCHGISRHRFFPHPTASHILSVGRYSTASQLSSCASSFNPLIRYSLVAHGRQDKDHGPPTYRFPQFEQMQLYEPKAYPKFVSSTSETLAIFLIAETLSKRIVARRREILGAMQGRRPSCRTIISSYIFRIFCVTIALHWLTLTRFIRYFQLKCTPKTM